MASNPRTYTGKDCKLKFGTLTHSSLGVSDFTLTLDRGTVEQELVGEIGNYTVAGSLSVEGSLTACKLEDGAAGELLQACISGTKVAISGSVAGANSTDNSVHWYFISCAITGFDIALGDADTITEGSIDFVVMDPQNVTITKENILDQGGVWIKDI